MDRPDHPPSDAGAIATAASVVGTREDSSVEGTRVADVSPLATTVGASGPLRETSPGTYIGRYRILRRLGSGGMGVVYAAHDAELARDVALKVLREDREGNAAVETRLQREAQAMARLSHENVVTVFDVGVHQGQVFLAMELIDGATLADWQGAAKRRWQDVVDVYVAAGRGLAAAHAAGIVHRDFKPGNVMLDERGRVRVTDFGLARSIEVGDVGAPASRGAAETALIDRIVTRAGALVGTPRYMAPEQLDRETATASSDQFSFCVSLFEGVYGVAPFAGANTTEALAEIRAGRITFPARTKVPAWLRRVLVRGLAADPARRFPSIEALLDAIVRGRRRPVRVAAAVALLAVVGAAVGITLRLQHVDSRVCLGAAEKLAGAWDDAVRLRVRVAFIATSPTRGAAAFDRVRAALDDYARAWEAMYGDACEATHLRGEQSSELLDLRMACLTSRRETLGAFSGLLAHADPRLIDDAITSAGRLPAVADCADLALLRGSFRAPEDPLVRSQVAAQRQRIAQAWASEAAGHYLEAAGQATPILATARTLAYRPLEAEADLLLGTVLHDLANNKGAETTLTDALVAAEASHHDEVAARASTLLTHVVGIGLGRPTEGRAWARRAHAALEALGGDERIEARLLNHEAVMLVNDAHYDEALALLARARALRERLYGATSVEVATELDNVSMVYQERGDYALASETLKASLAIKEKLLGPDHPLLTDTLDNEGAALQSMGRYDEALALHRRAATIEQASRGESVSLAGSLVNIGICLYNLDRYQEAIDVDERALAIKEKHLAPDHPAIATSLLNLASAYKAIDRFDDAERVLERALAIRSKHNGPEHPDTLGVEINLANLLTTRGRCPEALVRYERARDVITRSLAADHPLMFNVLSGLGKCNVALHHGAVAVPLIEHALQLLVQRKLGAEREAATRLLLAKALWDAGRHDEARAAAALARTELREFPASSYNQELADWVAGHH